MPLPDKFALIIFCLTWIAQIFRPRLLQKYCQLIWFLGLTGILGFIFYSSFLQYQIWDNDLLGRFFLPPYQNLDYFFYYAGWHFLAPWLLALLAAVLFGKTAKYFNQHFQERFLEKEEIQFLTIGIFLTGYPGFVLYIALVLTAGLLNTAIHYLLPASDKRASLYYFWLPLAIFAIIIKDFILPVSILNIFTI